MVKPPDINQTTIDEWRKLGFFYDHEDKDGYWKFIGSVSGLLKFCGLIDQYVSNPNNNPEA